MMTFRNNYLRNIAVPMSTNWLLNDLAEAKGKQELYTRQAPQLLKALRETALVQSVESSNRIVGVTVAADRLGPLVLGHARPKDRSEQEISGYREALSLIHSEAEHLQVRPDMLRRLLTEMKTTGQVICIGRGPGAKWQKRKEGHIPKRGS